jgi:hypothetical protein
MVKWAIRPTVTDKEVRALLEHYRCPVPFHEVRARLLGNIATPAVGPIKMVEKLWSGELSEFTLAFWVPRSLDSGSFRWKGSTWVWALLVRGAGIDARTTQSPAHRGASPQCAGGRAAPPATHIAMRPLRQKSRRIRRPQPV